MSNWVSKNVAGERKKLWVQQQVSAWQYLEGQTITKWVGNEMALREKDRFGEPVFHDPEIPFLQVHPLYVALDGGDARSILTAQDDDNWSLSIEPYYGALPDADCEKGSIFRTREMLELPVGPVDRVSFELDDQENISEVSLTVAGRRLTLWNGEVYEDLDGSLRVVRPDESILVYVNDQESGGM